MKSLFSYVLFIVLGIGNLNAQTRLSLNLYWSAERGDYFSGCSELDKANALGAGYSFAGIDCYILSTSNPGTIPLKLFWSPKRGDNFTTSTKIGEANALGAGYIYIRTMGYVFAEQKEGTVPLKLFWSPKREDNFVTAGIKSETLALADGYIFVGVEGYVYPFEQSQSVINKRPKIYGLVIGINDYTKTRSRSLNYCVKDATKVVEFLKSPQGGGIPSSQLITLLDSDATRDNIIKKAESLFSKADTTDLVIFYFSGHGTPNFFLAHDKLLAHEDLRTVIYKSKAKVKFCIADACHSGSWDKNFSYTEKDLSPEEMKQLYYNSLASTKNGLALLMACQRNETSLEASDLEQGLFTYYLLDGLNGNADKDLNHIITIEELYDYVKKKVSEDADNRGKKQHPQLAGLFDINTPVGIRK